jgi:hypothetical protein
MEKPTEEQIRNIKSKILKGVPLAPFDNGFVCALEWVLGERESLYEE